MKWKQIPWSNLEVHSNGDIFRNDERIHLKKSVDVRGRTVKVHRLIAEAFLPNPQNKPCVIHRNHNKSDNRIENLKWATKLEANHHRRRKYDLPRGVSFAGVKFCASVRFQNKNHYLGVYDTPEEASEVYEATVQELRGE